MRVCFITFVLILCSQVFAKTSETQIGYRVIRTNPQDFVNALRSPLAPANAKKAVQSRLDKFYKIKSKEVNGKDVTIELLPQIPVLSDYFPQSRALKVRLNEISHKADHFLFEALISLKTGSYLKSEMELSRCEAGTLLKLTLNDSAYSSVTLQVFREAAEALGFIYPTAQLAIQNGKVSAAEGDPISTGK